MRNKKQVPDRHFFPSMVSWDLIFKEALMNKNDFACTRGGAGRGERISETQGFWIVTQLKHLPIKKYPLQACHCFTKGAAPPGAVWPGELCTGQPQHTVITLIGSTTVRNMFGTAGDFISTDFPSRKLTGGKWWLCRFLTNRFHRIHRSKAQK